MNNNELFFGEPKMRPVFLLLDVSGSMSDHGKIDELNQSVRILLKDLKSQTEAKSYFGVSVYTFGETVENILPLTKLPDYNIDEFPQMNASGLTPMGEALMRVKDFVENNEDLKRSYRPVIILVTDGMPNDAWEKSVEAFANTGRTARCERYALSIGADEGTPQYDMLMMYTKDKEKICPANKAGIISRFFQVISVSMIGNNNQKPNFQDFSLNNLEKKTADNPAKEDDDDSFEREFDMLLR